MNNPTSLPLLPGLISSCQTGSMSFDSLIGPSIEDNPPLLSLAQPEIHESFALTMTELEHALLSYISPSKVCYAQELCPSSEALRVDPMGKRSGFIFIVRGLTVKDLSKLAVPPAASEREFNLTFQIFFNYLSKNEDQFYVVYSQGYGVVLSLSDWCFVMTGNVFTAIKNHVRKARKLK